MSTVLHFFGFFATRGRKGSSRLLPFFFSSSSFTCAPSVLSLRGVYVCADTAVEMDLSPLQRKRLRYQPTLPDCLAAGTHLFKFTVVDNDIDKPWRKEEKEKVEEEEAKQQQLKRAGERGDSLPAPNANAGVASAQGHEFAPPHRDRDGDRGGRLVDVAEYFPHTATTPVYHVVPGPALAGAGLAAAERVKPIRMEGLLMTNRQ